MLVWLKKLFGVPSTPSNDQTPVAQVPMHAPATPPPDVPAVAPPTPPAKPERIAASRPAPQPRVGSQPDALAESADPLCISPFFRGREVGTQAASGTPPTISVNITHPAYGVVLIQLEKSGVQPETTACYLVGESLLIDTGCAWARTELRKALMELGADKTIREVVNTHDHHAAIGNNGLLLEFGKPRFFAHHLAIPAIRFRDETDALRPANDPVVEIESLPERLRTAHCELEVLHLPGHAPGHVCLFEPGQRWLFSADLDALGVRDAELAEADGPVWLASLEKVIALRPGSLFDARGRIARQEADVLARLEKKREFLLALQRAILAEADGAQTLQDITHAVFDRRSLEKFAGDGRCGTGASPVTPAEGGWATPLLAASAPARHRLVTSFLRQRRAPAPL